MRKGTTSELMWIVVVIIILILSLVLFYLGNYKLIESLIGGRFQ